MNPLIHPALARAYAADSLREAAVRRRAAAIAPRRSVFAAFRAFRRRPADGVSVRREAEAAC